MNEQAMRPGSRPRRGERGAVMVEATIVISFFVLMFLGVIYFRDLYMHQIRAQRLARAGALAQAMSGCEKDAASILGQDARGLRLGDERTASDVRYPLEGQDVGDSKSDSVVRKLPQGQEGARGMVATVTLSGEASATTQRDTFAKEEGFRGTATSTSYVMCADSVNNDQYGGIAGYVTDVFGTFF